MNKSFLDSDQIDEEQKSGSSGSIISIFSDDENADGGPTNSSVDGPETMAETVRRSGLAYSAGIAFFASVVFMLVIGWGADLILGSSPWGIVGGIVLGSIIGFIQFFRITSRIFRPDQKDSEPTTLFGPNNREK